MHKIHKQKEILRQIAQASAAIRRKHRLIKSGKEAVAQTMNDVFKPLVAPLHKLIDISEDTKPIKKGMKQIKNEMNQIKEELMKPKEEANELLESKEEDDASFLTANDDEEEGEEDEKGDEERKEEKIGDQSPSEEAGYLEMMKHQMRKRELDSVCGVRKLAHDNLMVGNSPISFVPHHVRIGDTFYPKTKGLLELLFKRVPDDSLVTSADQKSYQEIVLQTNAHKNYYESDKPIRSQKSNKLKNIMGELLKTSPPMRKRKGELLRTGSVMKTRKGEGLLPRSMVAQPGVRQEYVFWDDPNELVERLRLLLASQVAGNSSHSNKIMSIIEELREAGIIY